MEKTKKAAITTAAGNGMDAGNENCTADTLTIDNDNAPENDAINDTGDMSLTIENDLDEGAPSDADECNPADETESENASAEDTCTTTDNSDAVASNRGAFLDINHGNADDNCDDSKTYEDIDISTLPPKLLQGFPLQIFPSWVRNYIEYLCLTVQVPVVFAANLFLSIISACISLVVYVSTGDHREPTNIWTMSLGMPGLGKSAVFRNLLQPLMNSTLREHVIGDITIPCFMKLLKEKHKLFMFEDELGFFNKLIQGKDLDYPSLTRSYDEDFISHGRCINSLEKITSPSLTMGIAGQQKVFLKLFNSEIGQSIRDNGILDRIAVCIAESTGLKDYMHSQGSENRQTKAVYQEKMDQLLAFVQDMEEAGAPLELQLSPEADYYRRTVLQSWENQTAIDSDFEMIHSWIYKVDGLSLRYAGIIYMISLITGNQPSDSTNLPQISKEIMEQVFCLLEFYRDNTIMLHHYISSGVLSPFAIRVFNKIRAAIRKGRTGDCSERDVKQAVRDEHGKLNEPAYNTAIKELVDNEWIAVEEPPRQNRRGRPASKRIRIIRGQSQKSAA